MKTLEAISKKIVRIQITIKKMKIKKVPQPQDYNYLNDPSPDSRLKTPDSILFLQIPEIHRHQPAYSRLLHRYTIDYIHGTHRHFIVGYNNEL